MKKYIIRDNDFINFGEEFFEELTELELNQFIKDRIELIDFQEYFEDNRKIDTVEEMNKIIDTLSEDIKIDIVENILYFLVEIKEFENEKELGELEFIDEFIDKEKLFRTIIEPIIIEKLNKFYNANRNDFICYVDTDKTPVSVNLSELEYVDKKDSIKTIINTYIYEHLYDIYHEDIWDSIGEKTYELVERFIRENKELKPYFNSDYGIFDTDYGITNLKAKITTMIVEDIRVRTSVDFLAEDLDNITITVG